MQCFVRGPDRLPAPWPSQTEIEWKAEMIARSIGDKQIGAVGLYRERRVVLYTREKFSFSRREVLVIIIKTVNEDIYHRKKEKLYEDPR